MTKVVKALFPISPSEKRFRTATTVPALAYLSTQMDEVQILIADRWMLYNEFARQPKVDFRATLLLTRPDRTFYQQRKVWIDRLLRHPLLAGSDVRWSVTGIDDVADGKCFSVLRNVLIAFHTIAKFRDDVTSDAVGYVVSHGGSVDMSQRIQLSISYILEEIAVSITLHVLHGIESEYYIGSLLSVVKKMYLGHYGITVYDICDVAEVAQRRFCFVEIGDADDPSSWVRNYF